MILYRTLCYDSERGQILVIVRHPGYFIPAEYLWVTPQDYHCLHVWTENKASPPNWKEV